jgi:hypothetical protein
MSTLLRWSAAAVRAVLLLGVGSAAGSCGGGDNTGPNEPPPGTPVATVELTPATLDLQVGGTSRLTATPRAASGAALSGRTITWASADLARATVDDEGMVTAVAEGEVEISATSEGKAGTATVTILATGSVARTWKGKGSGLSEDWSDPDNWEPLGKPGHGDVVRLPAGTDIVYLSEDVQVAKLIISGGLMNISNRRLLIKPLPPPPLVRREQP